MSRESLNRLYSELNSCKIIARAMFTRDVYKLHPNGNVYYCSFNCAVNQGTKQDFLQKMENGGYKAILV